MEIYTNNTTSIDYPQHEKPTEGKTRSSTPNNPYQSPTTLGDSRHTMDKPSISNPTPDANSIKSPSELEAILEDVQKATDGKGLGELDDTASTETMIGYLQKYHGLDRDFGEALIKTLDDIRHGNVDGKINWRDTKEARKILNSDPDAFMEKVDSNMSNGATDNPAEPVNINQIFTDVQTMISASQMKMILEDLQEATDGKGLGELDDTASTDDMIEYLKTYHKLDEKLAKSIVNTLDSIKASSSDGKITWRDTKEARKILNNDTKEFMDMVNANMNSGISSDLSTILEDLENATDGKGKGELDDTASTTDMVNYLKTHHNLDQKTAEAIVDTLDGIRYGGEDGKINWKDTREGRDMLESDPEEFLKKLSAYTTNSLDNNPIMDVKVAITPDKLIEIIGDLQKATDGKGLGELDDTASFADMIEYLKLYHNLDDRMAKALVDTLDGIRYGGVDGKINWKDSKEAYQMLHGNPEKFLDMLNVNANIDTVPNLIEMLEDVQKATDGKGKGELDDTANSADVVKYLQQHHGVNEKFAKAIVESLDDIRHGGVDGKVNWKDTKKGIKMLNDNPEEFLNKLNSKFQPLNEVDPTQTSSGSSSGFSGSSLDHQNIFDIASGNAPRPQYN